MADRKHVLHVKSNVAETTTQYGIDDFLVTPKKPVDSVTGKATDDTLLYGEIAVNYGKGVEALTIRNTEDNIVAFVNENDFHEANEIAADGLASEKLEREEADATEKMERVEADESLRDDLDEMSGVYDTNHRGPVVRDNDGNEVFELTDSGLVQIDYPDGGHEHPAIQINGDTVKVKDTEGVVRIEVNEVGVRLKGAPNDDTTEPEITLNKDNAGGVTIKGGSDTNFVLKPDIALLNSHSNGLGYKYDMNNLDDQTLQIDLGSDTIVKAVTRLENDGVVDREENVSVKTPNTMRGMHENIMQANGRRYILYHPGGTAQMLHSNPSGTDKNGNVTGKVFFLDSYHDGGDRLLEVTDVGDRTQGQYESHTVNLRCPGIGDEGGLRIERSYNPSSGTDSHHLEMMTGGNGVLWSQVNDESNGLNATTSVQVNGNDLMYGNHVQDGDGNDIEKSVLITAAGDHDVLRGAYTKDTNTGNRTYETCLMTNGDDILRGAEYYPTDGGESYETSLRTYGNDTVTGYIRCDSSGNEFEHSILITAAGNHDVLTGRHTTDQNTGNENYETIVMTNGNDTVYGQCQYDSDGNDIDRSVTITAAGGGDVLYGSYNVDQNTGNIEYNTNLMTSGNDTVVGHRSYDSNWNDVEASVRIVAAGEHDVLRGAFTSDPNTGDTVRETRVMTDGNSILTGRENLPTSGNNVYTMTLNNADGDEVLRAEKRDGNNQTVSVSMENSGNGQLLDAYYDIDNGNKHISIMNNGDDVLVSNYLDGTSSEVTLYNNGDTVLHAIVRTQGGTSQEQKEFSIGFLPDEIMISDPNRQQISLADYIGERIPTVPTNVSAFTNDAGYLTQNDLSDYVDKETFDNKEEVISTALNELHDSIPNMDNYYTKTEIDNKFSEIETLLSQI